jgi:hypothetical protein
MRISLRTSGGRGEYELAGSQGGIKSRELADREILFQLNPNLIVPSFSVLKHVQGKPRIRLLKGKNAVHAYRLMSSILLLPKPIRELSKTASSKSIMVEGAYSILGIDVDVLSFDDIYVILRPKAIIAGNLSNVINKISVAEKLASIYQLWNTAEEHEGKLAELVIDHRNTILNSVNFSHKEIERVAELIRQDVGIDGNIVKYALGLFDTEDLSDEEEGLQVVEFDEGDNELSESEHDADTPIESSRKQIKEWRKVLSRGKDGRNFSVKIKEIYDNKCAFTGLRLPATEKTVIPGVDACHILPWAEHQVNDLRNGLCLNKTMPLGL